MSFIAEFIQVQFLCCKRLEVKKFPILTTTLESALVFCDYIVCEWLLVSFVYFGYIYSKSLSLDLSICNLFCKLESFCKGDFFDSGNLTLLVRTGCRLHIWNQTSINLLVNSSQLYSFYIYYICVPLNFWYNTSACFYNLFNTYILFISWHIRRYFKQKKNLLVY